MYFWCDNSEQNIVGSNENSRISFVYKVFIMVNWAYRPDGYE